MADHHKARLCLCCCKDIPLKAVKCIYCDSYQDWRRYLIFSSTILSLLIALLSVTALTLPVLTKYLQGDYSDLRVSYFVYTETGLSLIASNAGTKPGTIKSCKLLLYRDDNPTRIILPFNCDLAGRNQSRIVKGGEVTELFFNINTPSWFKQVVWREAKGDTSLINNGVFKLKLEVGIVQYDKTNEEIMSSTPTAAKDLLYDLR